MAAVSSWPPPCGPFEPPPPNRQSAPRRRISHRPPGAELVRAAADEAASRLVAMLNAAIPDDRYRVTEDYLLDEGSPLLVRVPTLRGRPCASDLGGAGLLHTVRTGGHPPTDRPGRSPARDPPGIHDPAAPDGQVRQDGPAGRPVVGDERARPLGGRIAAGTGPRRAPRRVPGIRVPELPGHVRGDSRGGPWAAARDGLRDRLPARRRVRPANGSSAGRTHPGARVRLP